jgi:hypothetical protein
VQSSPEFDRFTARVGVDCLRDGVPPPEAVCEWLTFGRKELLEGFQERLQLAEEGEPSCSVLLGDPGSGKTHLLKIFRHCGKRRRFVIYQCTQDLIGKITFNRPDLVYGELLRSMELPTNFSDSSDSLIGLLHEWARLALPFVQNASPRTNPVYRLSHQYLLPKANTIPKRTALALFVYLRALERDVPDVEELVTNVFRGMKVENRAIVRAGEKVGVEPHFIGYTPSSYDIDYWLGQFGVICYMTRATRLSGSLVLLDEIESLIDLNNVSSRRKAYEVLSHIIANQSGMASLVSILSCTPAFLRHLRQDIGALGHTVSDQWKTLKAFKLSKLSMKDALALIEKIGQLCAIAYSSDRPFELSSEHEVIASEWLRNGSSVGELVRTVVNKLDCRD